jgi:hypothetical protein
MSSPQYASVELAPQSRNGSLAGSEPTTSPLRSSFTGWQSLCQGRLSARTPTTGRRRGGHSSRCVSSPFVEHRDPACRSPLRRAIFRTDMLERGRPSSRIGSRCFLGKKREGHDEWRISGSAAIVCLAKSEEWRRDQLWLPHEGHQNALRKKVVPPSRQ